MNETERKRMEERLAKATVYKGKIDALNEMFFAIGSIENKIRIVTFEERGKVRGELLKELYDQLRTRGFSLDLETRLRGAIQKEIQATIDQLEAKYADL